MASNLASPSPSDQENGTGGGAAGRAAPGRDRRPPPRPAPGLSRSPSTASGRHITPPEATRGGRIAPVATPLAPGVRKWGLITLAVTAIGLLNFFVVVTSRLAEGSRPSAKEPFVWEMTGAYSFLLVLPALLRFFRRFPL